MTLVTFQRLGTSRNTPRLWLESQRLEVLGFSVGTPLAIRRLNSGIRVTPAKSSGNHVSHRIVAGGKRPIIDIANRSALRPLTEFREIKLVAQFGKIDALPSIRGFSIAGRLAARPPFRTVEVFCGGGTLSAAVAASRSFQLVAGLEIEPKFADVWSRAHQNAALFQTDIRLMHPSEVLAHDVLIASIPCTSHSTLGRAKKSLAGKPELGDTGDLYLSVSHIIANHLPAACLFENVPAFANSLACLSLMDHLKKLGYSIFEAVLDPHNAWNEPQNRRRWIAVATLKPGFQITAPLVPFSSTIKNILDRPSETDRQDAQRIAGSIESLKRHRDRHSKLGHGFGFTLINQHSTRVPTIVRSYHKINTGPFVQTDHGPRLLRKHEVERLMGCEINCDHYATAIEILGQGVQTRVFRQILEQLAGFLQRTA